jgi:hypothetical protein
MYLYALVSGPVRTIAEAATEDGHGITAVLTSTQFGAPEALDTLESVLNRRLHMNRVDDPGCVLILKPVGKNLVITDINWTDQNLSVRCCGDRSNWILL